MFTGLVEETGRVREPVRDGRLAISCGVVLADAEIGSSVAVDGCCLTVTTVDDDAFVADVMGETLGRTTLGGLGVDDLVNLERPLRADARLGGHIVQGHVDGVGEVRDAAPAPGSTILTIGLPSGLAPHVVEKGSIAVNGVSLTVIDAGADTFTVGIIPHTADVTNLGRLSPGDRVNLEVDVVAKYVARLADPYLGQRR